MIEMNFDQQFIKRNIYNFIDLISDVGGLYSFLASSVFLFVSAWNHNGMENYLVTKLFKVKPSSPAPAPGHLE